LWIYLGRFPSTERDGTSVVVENADAGPRWHTKPDDMLPMTKEASEKYSSRVRLQCMYARMCWCKGVPNYYSAAFHLLLFACLPSS
jgi:hypothetical protein